MSLTAEKQCSGSKVVELENIQFTWPGQDGILLQIESLQIDSGERVFLYGQSGSGKSTLLSIVAGVLVAQTGTTRILGESIHYLGGSARDRFRADHIGIIFQQFNLIPYLSVVENVILPCHFSRNRREKVVTRSGSEKNEAIRLLQHLDMAAESTLHNPVTELSAGQQQRVAVARALIGSPEILIADEPTSSMDADRRHAFIDLLFQECRESGATLLFVSHDHGLQAPFDRTIALEKINRVDADISPTLGRAG